MFYFLLVSFDKYLYINRRCIIVIEVFKDVIYINYGIGDARRDSVTHLPARRNLVMTCAIAIAIRSNRTYLYVFRLVDGDGEPRAQPHSERLRTVRLKQFYYFLHDLCERSEKKIRKLLIIIRSYSVRGTVRLRWGVPTNSSPEPTIGYDGGPVILAASFS